MLDFTKNIILKPKWQKHYQVSRAVLYAMSIIGAFVFAYKLIFPSISFGYFFSASAENKSTMPEPYNSDNVTLKKGTLIENKKIIIDNTLVGNFSDAKATITLAKNSPDVTGELSLRKSYQAFLYPTSDPVNFPNGSLLFSAGNFYMISLGERRQFASREIMQTLGFTLDMFIIVDADELGLNKEGNSISDTTSYPDGALFVINDTYYQLTNSRLYAFVSEKAFTSHYDLKLAAKKELLFLEKYELADEQIGLADGTLAAIGESVSILSAGKSYPIFSPQIFENMGFNWNDVYQANSEEVGIYKKQKLSMQGIVHPDGTIFKDAETENYFIIKNGQKHPLIGTHLIQFYINKIRPVIANSASLNNNVSCTLNKKILSWQKTYTCAMPLEKIMGEKGNDYQFIGKFGSEIRISQINTTFDTALNMKNMKNSLSRIKALILSTHSS